MTTQLRSGVVDLKPEPQLEGAVECDEGYIVAGRKSHPEAVKKGCPGRRRLNVERGRGALEKEKPPVQGMIRRGDQAVIKMVSDVKQQTIKPIITKRGKARAIAL